MKLEPRDRIVVVGKTGTGKSTYAKALLAAHLEAGGRAIAFDPLDEYSQKGKASSQVRLGPLKNRCTVDQLVMDPRRWLDQPDLSLSVVPSNEESECAADFATVAEQVEHTGRLLLLVDEVGLFGEHAVPKLKRVATVFRHFEVPVILVAQRATQIHLTARSQASQIVAFQQDEVADLDALQARCGLHIPDIAERVARLPPGQHVHWRAHPSLPEQLP